MAARSRALERAYVGLGSNLEDPRAQLESALAALDARDGVTLAAVSRMYANPPMGPVPQPDYVNAVAAIDTTLGPRALLAALLAIEASHGRRRGDVRWGPRVLDLDLLLYGDTVIDEPDLVVPHPGMAERAFVLHPLCELAPDAAVPGLGTVAELAARVSANGLVAVDPLATAARRT